MRTNKESFVTAYMAAYKDGHSAVWLANKLGVHRQAVYDRVAKLHEQGIKLPKLPRFDAQTQEKERLNTLITEQLGKQPKGK